MSERLWQARRLLLEAQAEARRAAELYELVGDAKSAARVREGLAIVSLVLLELDGALAAMPAQPN